MRKRDSGIYYDAAIVKAMRLDEIYRVNEQ
jgi:hypothetical protein